MGRQADAGGRQAGAGAQVAERVGVSVGVGADELQDTVAIALVRVGGVGGRKCGIVGVGSCVVERGRKPRQGCYPG